MSSNKPLQITTPVGRLIGGSLYEARTTDYEGNPLIHKSGVNSGKPRVDFSFGVAFPKSPGVTHFSQEAWLAPVYALAVAAFTNGETQRPDFSWKITDGDSTMPNKKGKRPCDNENQRGNWIIWFAGAQAPKIYNRDGSALITEPGAVKPGYFVQVYGNVTDNKPAANAGVYMNHSMVALAAYGEEIIIGPDASEVGFGTSALPAGASMTPPAAFTPPPATMAPPPPAAVVMTPPPPVPVTPNPAILAIPKRVMLPPAQGATYEAMIGAGWTDALLVANGMMQP